MNQSLLKNIHLWANENIRSSEITDHAERFNIPKYEELFDTISAEPGDAIIIGVPSGQNFLHAVVTTLQHGLVPILVPPGVNATRLKEISAQTGAKAILSLNVHSEVLGKTFYSSGNIFLTVGEHPKKKYEPGEIILTTSGTIGLSSGCLFKFDRLIENARMHLETVPLKKSDKVLTCLPLCFSYAFVAQFLAAFLAEADFFIMPPPFSPQSFSAMVRNNRITATALTPFLLRQLIRDDSFFADRLRLLTVGGDRLELSEVKKLFGFGKIDELYLTYGLTEAGPRVSTLAVHDAPESKWGTVGKPLRNVEAIIRNKDSNEFGQLFVKTPTAALRYVGLRDNSAVTETQNAAGEIDTGDIFERDEEGYLTFRGRTKDFVIIKGEKVNLSFIRHIVQDNKLVKKAAIRLVKNGEEIAGYKLILNLYPWIYKHQVSVQTIVKRLRVVERPLEIEFCTGDSEDRYK